MRVLSATSLSLVLFAFCACSGRQASFLLPDLNRASVIPHRPKVALLFVANAGNNTVTVYRPGASTPLRTIRKGVDLPLAMALDVKGTLYLTGGKDLTVYAAGESSPARTIKVSGWAVALDKSGLLYAAYNPSIVFGVCPCGNVYVYESRGIKLLRKIRAFEPSSLAFDASNNLYVANTYEHDEVAVYANGGVVPFRRITNGIASPHALAFDNAGDLYVANSASNSIGVYAGTGGTPIRVITEGVSNPVALVFDKTGNLYVANRASRGKGTVTVYAPGRSSPLHILHSGAFMPDALAIETTSDDLYVAESAWGNGNGQVAVFTQGVTKPYATILKGIDSPIALSFSP